MKNHFLSMSQLTKDNLYDFFTTVDDIKSKDNVTHLLKNKIIVNVFHEKSTRTRCSFEAAAIKLGANVITETAETSSSGKNERLEDTIRSISQYSNLIVLRHPAENAAKNAAPFSYVPIINAGDGSNEHPTQTLLDLYTIRNHKLLDNPLNIMFVGDLKYGRTVHSWIHALKLFKWNVYFAPARGSELPAEMRIAATHVDNPAAFLPQMDVLYMTRQQFERGNVHIPSFTLYPDHLDKMKTDAIILHPLPRGQEIHPDCDDNHRSLYHTEQVTNGLYVRMALLNAVLKGELF